MAIAAAGAIAWVLSTQWSTIADYDWELSVPWLVLGAVLVLLSYQSMGVTYARSVEQLSVVNPPRREALSIWARSLLARYIPGNVMMVVGRAVMAARWGVSRRITVAATVYEQVLLLGVGAVASVLYLVLYRTTSAPTVVAAAIVVGVGVAALHPRVFNPLSSWLLRKLRREPLTTVLTGRQIGRLAVGYTVASALAGLGAWALVRAAAGAAIGGPLEITLGFLLAFLVSMVAFIFPSGLGVRDGLLALLFAANLDAGAGPALALAVGLRFALVLIELAYVAAVVGYARWRR